MSSAINHQKRSRRGYKMQRSFLADKNSPLISRSPKLERKAKAGLLRQIFRRMMGYTT